MSSSAISGPIFSDNKRAPAGTAAAPSFAFNDSTGTGVYLVSPGVLGLSTAGVQRVVVDASGNVGIGTASPANYGTANTTTLTAFRADQNITIGAYWQAGVGQYSFINSGTTNNATAVALAFQTGGTERMRLDSSGNLHTGRTGTGASAQGNTLGLITNGAGYNESVSTDAGGTLAIWYMNRQSSNGTVIEFRRAAAGVGSITVTASNTAFNTGPSDHRLKEDVQEFSDGLSKIKALRPVSFKWKDSQRQDIGFIAHEIQAVVPECVTGEKDAVDAEGNPAYQSVFPAPAQMIATLVAAIQEQQAQIEKQSQALEALKAEVAALKAP